MTSAKQELIAAMREVTRAYAALAAAEADAPAPLTPEEVEILRDVRIFEGMNPDQFRWLVERVEMEHGIRPPEYWKIRP